MLQFESSEAELGHMAAGTMSQPCMGALVHAPSGNLDIQLLRKISCCAEQHDS